MSGSRDAIGASATVTNGYRTQMRTVRSRAAYLFQNELRLHFCLGEDVATDLQVCWTMGGVEQYTDVPGNQSIVVTEGQGWKPEL